MLLWSPPRARSARRVAGRHRGERGLAALGHGDDLQEAGDAQHVVHGRVGREQHELAAERGELLCQDQDRAQAEARDVVDPLKVDQQRPGAFVDVALHVLLERLGRQRVELALRVDDDGAHLFAVGYVEHSSITLSACGTPRRGCLSLSRPRCSAANTSPVHRTYNQRHYDSPAVFAIEGSALAADRRVSMADVDVASLLTDPRAAVGATPFANAAAGMDLRDDPEFETLEGE